MKATAAIGILLLAAFAVSGCTGGKFTSGSEVPSRGSVCGSNEIAGKAVADITARNPAYGIDNPVEITNVSGVELSTAAILNCETALKLSEYVENVAIPVIGNTGGGLVEMEVAASYVYRTRNSQRGARISEHALGNAIDISGFVLADGKELVVEEDWGLAMVKELHADACGTFGTVLGPEADRFHHNHFHFDTASYRSGPWCR